MSSLYPKDFPLAQALEVLSIARQNKVKEKLPLFAHNLWVLQGYAQGTFIGDPDKAPAVSSGGTTAPAETGGVLIPDFTTLSVADPLAALQKVCDEYQSDAITAQASVPWKSILKWALEELVKVVATGG